MEYKDQERDYVKRLMAIVSTPEHPTPAIPYEVTFSLVVLQGLLVFAREKEIKSNTNLSALNNLVAGEISQPIAGDHLLRHLRNYLAHHDFVIQSKSGKIARVILGRDERSRVLLDPAAIKRIIRIVGIYLLGVIDSERKILSSRNRPIKNKLQKKRGKNEK